MLSTVQAATSVAELPAKFKVLIPGYVLEVVKVTDYGGYTGMCSSCSEASILLTVIWKSSLSLTVIPACRFQFTVN